MDVKLPRLNRGDELLARHINEPNEFLEKLSINIGPNSTLGKSEGPNGTTLWARLPVEFWARVTSGGGGTGGSSGKYAWTEQLADGSGGWTAGYNSGTTAENFAYESTGNTTVPANTIVRMRLDEGSNGWIFTYRKC